MTTFSTFCKGSIDTIKAKGGIVMSRKGLSRRKFMALASLGVTSAYITLQTDLARAMMGSGGGGGGMGGGGGTGVINPPPGSPFKDPVEMANLSTTPGIVEVNLEAESAWVNVNGTMANLLTYNGAYPAPTIHVRKGELLKVHFKNSLPMMGTNILGHERDMTNLHTHGLHVSPSGNADNSMLMFMSGETFDYEFDLSRQYPGTLNFYHPHHHGTVAEQYWGGLAGALVVEDDINVLADYETHLMVIKDISLSGSAPEPYTSQMEYMQGKEGNTVMVNGQVNPVLPIQPGQVQRWRVLNACNARFLKLSLEGHTMYIVGTEGGLIDKPYAVSSILLSPGERLDILVKANQTARNYRLLSLPYSRQGNMGGEQVTLMTLAYQGVRTNDAIPATVNSAAGRLAVTPVKTERLVLSMGQGRGYINGITFTETNCYKICSRLGTHEVWEIVNQSGMDHPFHQHVNACQVLSVSGGDAAYASFLTKTPAWKDTVIVPKWGSVKLLVPVMDYAGMAMFHCHIIEHEDIGMMGVWDIM
jgi:FtsP/CotA-like multicopper oxidase with cupredoxin domain